MSERSAHAKMLRSAGAKNNNGSKTKTLLLLHFSRRICQFGLCRGHRVPGGGQLGDALRLAADVVLVVWVGVCWR